jgi:hypothetical protein
MWLLFILLGVYVPLFMLLGVYVLPFYVLGSMCPFLCFGVYVLMFHPICPPSMDPLGVFTQAHINQEVSTY